MVSDLLNLQFLCYISWSSGRSFFWPIINGKFVDTPAASVPMLNQSSRKEKKYFSGQPKKNHSWVIKQCPTTPGSYWLARICFRVLSSVLISFYAESIPPPNLDCFWAFPMLREPCVYWYLLAVRSLWFTFEQVTLSRDDSSPSSLWKFRKRATNKTESEVRFSTLQLRRLTQPWRNKMITHSRWTLLSIVPYIRLSWRIKWSSSFRLDGLRQSPQ